MDLFTTLIAHTNKGLDHAQHMEIKGLDLVTSIECHPCCAAACAGLVITLILFSLGYRLGLCQGHT